ncbi:MAG: TetR/AcrR family transcriptional regulator [Bacteroidales bacterium]|nr:TetR/AcrR family transcriptional regulator [Bacteroidales bacterium]
MGISERKEREREQRRSDIIDAAERIIFKRGLENSTMDDIAEEAELSKGTLYLYYKSKEDIQFAIFRRGAEILLKFMEKNIESKSTGYEKLLELAATTVQFSQTHSNYFQFFMMFETSQLDKLNIERSSAEKYLLEETPLSIVDKCVELGIEDGSLRNDIPSRIFSATLWTQLLGLLVIMNNKSDIYKMFNISQTDILQTHLTLVSNGAVKD